MKLRTLSRVTLGLAAASGFAGMVACSSGDSTSPVDTTPAATAGGATSESTEANPLDRPVWAASERLTGMVDDAEPINLQVHLKLHNYQAAVDELYAVSTPGNAEFGKFLSDDDFATKYAPTAEDVAVVRAHLEAHGLTVTNVADFNMYLQVTGTAAQVKTAFTTRLGTYNVNGLSRRGPVDQPTLPSDILSRVGGVLGLSSTIPLRPHNITAGSLLTANGITTNNITADHHGTDGGTDGGTDSGSDAGTDGGTTDAGAGNAFNDNCSTYFGQNVSAVDPPYGDGYATQLPNYICGYTPEQLRGAYGTDTFVSRHTDGTGVTVAILDAYQSPTLLADAQKYAAAHDASHPLTSAQFTAVTGPATFNPEPPVDTGWYGEQSLDVEAIHAAAPGANIVFVGAASASDQDFAAALNMIIAKRMATMVSNSWGSPEAQANDFVVMQQSVLHAGLKGIGVYFSSGDSGDYSSFADPSQDLQTGPSASFPADLPHVTAVGGTSLALDAKNNYTFETGWASSLSILGAELADGGAIPTDDAGNPVDGGPTVNVWGPAAPGTFYGGAGGGVSLNYTQPRFQRGIVPAAIANAPGVASRVVPDVAALADPFTGFLIGLTDPMTGQYSESDIGGTSLACPLFVGTMALAQQHAGHTLGFANPQIYALKAGAFRDVTSAKTPQAVNFIIPNDVTAVITLGYHGESIDTAVGYDTITGLGSPNGSAFVEAFK